MNQQLIINQWLSLVEVKQANLAGKALFSNFHQEIVCKIKCLYSESTHI